MEIIKSTTSWYVLYTSANFEKKVRNRLMDKGIECWLPLHQSPRVWSDRVKIVEVPLFRSYIFVKCKLSTLYTLTKVYGVSWIVSNNEKPAVIQQKEIDAIKIFLEKANDRKLIVGEEAEILVGPMKSISGTVKEIKKKFLYLYVEQIGVMVCVKLDDVAPVEKM